MKKSSLFFIASILGLASLTGVGSLVSSDGNSIQGARATGVIEDGKYFLTFDNTIGLSRNATTNAGLKTSFNDLVTPIYIKQDGDKYLIYQYDETGVEVYLTGDRNNTVTTIYFRTLEYIENAEGTASPKEYKFTITESDGLYKFKVGNYYLNHSTNFKTNSGDPGFQYSLISVESSSSGVAQKIKDIGCDNGVTPPSVSEWEEINTEYISLVTPIKNYLMTVSYDKDHPYNNIETQLIKYDYIIAKYNKSETIYTNYLLRASKNIEDFDTYRIETKENNNSSYLLIGVISISIVIMGITLLNIRKKKEH